MREWWKRFKHKWWDCDWQYYDTVYTQRRSCKICGRRQWLLFVPAAPGAFESWEEEDDA